MERIAGSTETSEGPSAVLDGGEAARLRTRTRRAYGGFGIGIVFSFVYTAAHVANGGYGLLPELLVWNLIWAPCMGAITAMIRPSRTRRPGPWRLGRPQLRTRTLMVVVAYVALLLGSYVATKELGDAARRYYVKWAGADWMAKFYHGRGLRRLGEYYEELAAKYDRARWRPWLPVEPDPPVPK